MPQATGLTDEERAVLAKCGFKPGVAYMPVPRCDGCRWWKAPSAIDGELGQCLRVVDSSGLTHGSKAIPLGGRDDLFGRLLTAPDFGCIQWEGKPDDG